MKIVKPYARIEGHIDGIGIVKSIEAAGRTCYKSEGAITGDSYVRFIQKIIRSGHHSVLEHEKVTVRIVCDRGITHEIVRHRIASFSQESSRYCNYSKDKFGNEINVIDVCFWPDKAIVDSEDFKKYELWLEFMEIAESYYFKLIELGAKAQEARDVLPNSTKTEIVMTANLREWRHFFTLRTAYAAHPQMREIAIPLLREFQKRIPVVFDDIEVSERAEQLW